jgi:hypothetical protein
MVEMLDNEQKYWIFIQLFSQFGKTTELGKTWLFREQASINNIFQNYHNLWIKSNNKIKHLYIKYN